MTTAQDRACPDWLALRREADTEARDAGAGGLLELLVADLRGRDGGPVRVVDVGAGTGANHAYLAPRLPLAQEWVVVDHDADLLGHAGHGDARRMEAGVADLGDVVHDLLADDPHGPLMLTCAALLDVLTSAELGRLAAAVETSGGPALFSLSVTGDVAWSPPDEADDAVGALFDEHQRRDGRPGPSAPEELVRDLRSRGLQVVAAPTPWTLDARRPDLLGRWLGERVDAAATQVGGRGRQHDVLAGWHRRRRGALRSSDLVARVGHVDLLVLPHGAQRPAGTRGGHGG